MLQARREVSEYGALPLHALCPQLDSHAALQSLHLRLLSKSSAGKNGARTVLPVDVASELQLTASQLTVLCEVLAALSISNSGPPGFSAKADSQTVLGSEAVFVHELSLFLLSQLFNKEVQRPDSNEGWPDTAAVSATTAEIMSPTRRSSSNGVGYLRQQQLQQQLRNQQQALRSFGDYVRRNLRLVLTLVADPHADSAPGPPIANGPHTTHRLSSAELERAAFLLHCGGGGGGGGAGHESAGPSPITSLVAGLSEEAQSVDTILAALKLNWHEDNCIGGSHTGMDSPPPLALRLRTHAHAQPLHLPQQPLPPTHALPLSPPKRHTRSSPCSGASRPGPPRHRASPRSSPPQAGAQQVQPQRRIPAAALALDLDPAPLAVHVSAAATSAARFTIFGNPSNLSINAHCNSLSPAVSFTYAAGGSLSPSARTRTPGLVASAGQVDESCIAGVHRGTVVRGEGELPTGEVRITDCHDSVVYVLAPLQSALLSGCSDCTIVLGAVGAMLRVERCDRVQLHVAANRILISSCHECVLYLGVGRPPCLVGDNRFLRLAPLNTRYERQAHHLHQAGVRMEVANRWDAPVVLAGGGGRPARLPVTRGHASCARQPAVTRGQRPDRARVRRPPVTAGSLAQLA
ncbi:MAG: hypothetical protein WDW38_011206 [Sanguina aurantia]